MKKFTTIISILFVCFNLCASTSFVFNDPSTGNSTEISNYSEFNKMIGEISSEEWYIGSWGWELGIKGGNFHIYTAEEYFGRNPKLNLMTSYMNDLKNTDNYICVDTEGILEILCMTPHVEFNSDGSFTLEGKDISPMLLIFNLSSLEKVYGLTSWYGSVANSNGMITFTVRD